MMSSSGDSDFEEIMHKFEELVAKSRKFSKPITDMSQVPRCIFKRATNVFVNPIGSGSGAGSGGGAVMSSSSSPSPSAGTSASPSGSPARGGVASPSSFSSKRTCDPVEFQTKVIQYLGEYCSHCTSQYASASGTFLAALQHVEEKDDVVILLEKFEELVKLYRKILDISTIHEYLVASGIIPTFFQVCGLVRVQFTPASLYNELARVAVSFRHLLAGNRVDEQKEEEEQEASPTL